MAQMAAAKATADEADAYWSTAPCTKWTAQSPQRLLFSALCRRGVAHVVQALDAIVPVVVTCAHPKADAAVRISVIALMEFMLTHSGAVDAKGAFSSDSNSAWVWLDVCGSFCMAVLGLDCVPFSLSFSHVGSVLDCFRCH